MMSIIQVRYINDLWPPVNLYNYFQATIQSKDSSSCQQNNTYLYMDVPKVTSQHKRIMVMTGTACCIKIIHTYNGYLNLLGFEHSNSLLSPYASSIFMMLVSMEVPLFIRLLAILQYLRKFFRKTSISNRWTHTSMCAYVRGQSVRNVSFCKILDKNIYYKINFIM